MAHYITKMYEVLDHIVNERYGDTENGIVEYVIEHNPGLEARDLVLPRGLRIHLPERPASTTPSTPVIRQVRLWD